MPAYADKHENLTLTRVDDGVLVLRFHTRAGPDVFTGQTHQDFPAALEEISLGRENKALVVTGTGDSFVDQMRRPEPGRDLQAGRLGEDTGRGREGAAAPA